MPPTLNEKVEVLRTQLGLAADLAIAEVVQAAAEQVGLSDDEKGNSLHSKADACMQKVETPGLHLRQQRGPQLCKLVGAALERNDVVVQSVGNARLCSAGGAHIDDRRAEQLRRARPRKLEASAKLG